jgi:hypothetical protein
MKIQADEAVTRCDEDVRERNTRARDSGSAYRAAGQFGVFRRHGNNLGGQLAA